jgi:hypothetical protein
MRRLLAFACVAVGLAFLSGCASKEPEPGMKVKDLKQRGLKDPDKDPITPKKGQHPGGVDKGGHPPAGP